MRYIITGATGFVGSRLLKRFIAGGHELIVIARNTSKAETLLLALTREERKRIHLVEGDVTSKDLGVARNALARYIGRIDAFYHLASRVKYNRDLTDDVYEINVQGTIHALELAEKLRVKQFFYVSSASAVGERREAREQLYPVNQKFNNPYEQSLVLAEQAVMSYYGKLDVAIFRPSIIVDYDTGLSPFPIRAFTNAIETFKQRVSKIGTPDEVYRMIGHPSGALNIVPLETVISVLDVAPYFVQSGKIYHLVHSEPCTMERWMAQVRTCLAFPNLTISTMADIYCNELHSRERQLNEMIGLYRPYLTMSKMYENENMNTLTYAMDIVFPPCTDDVLERIICSRSVGERIT
ncbi:MAG: SDR family NAD(P)-dependent oxidoreductase [Bacilli bacterium]